MSMINYVLEGKCKNEKLSVNTQIHSQSGKIFNKRYVSSYQLIDETNKDQYSFLKGAVGVALFGGLGAIAGVKGKRSKEYLVAIEWKDGEKSLISLNEDGYKTLVKNMF